MQNIKFIGKPKEIRKEIKEGFYLTTLSMFEPRISSPVSLLF